MCTGSAFLCRCIDFIPSSMWSNYLWLLWTPFLAIGYLHLPYQKSWMARKSGWWRKSWIVRISAFRAILSTRALSLHLEQHWGGHLDILTSPVTQSISRLCFHSQECPRMSFCLPRPVTANSVHSKWFRYLKMRSTTSVMEPASFRVFQHCKPEWVRRAS